MINSNERIKGTYTSFYAAIPKISEIISELKRKYPELEKYKNSGKPFHETEIGKNNKENYVIYSYLTGHRILYITSLDLTADDPIIGRGIKSFRNTCKEKWHKPNRVCQSHPHHYYLEILNYKFTFIRLNIFFIKSNY